MAFITLEEILSGILQEVHELRDLNKLECVTRVIRTVSLTGDLDLVEKEHRDALERIGRKHDRNLDISEAMDKHRAYAQKLRRKKPRGEMFLGPSVL